MKSLTLEPLDPGLMKAQKGAKQGKEVPLSATDRYLKGKTKMSSILRYMPSLFTLKKKESGAEIIGKTGKAK